MIQEDIFYFLTKKEFAQLLPYLTERDIDSGQDFLVEGKGAEGMGFLLSGRLVVKKSAEFPGKFQTIALLDPGASVGETEIVGESNNHSTTVSSLERSTLAILSKGSFQQLGKDHPDLAIKILSHLLHIVSVRLQKTSQRLSLIL